MQTVSEHDGIVVGGLTFSTGGYTLLPGATSPLKLQVNAGDTITPIIDVRANTATIGAAGVAGHR